MQLNLDKGFFDLEDTSLVCLSQWQIEEIPHSNLCMLQFFDSEIAHALYSSLCQKSELCWYTLLCSFYLAARNVSSRLHQFCLIRML